MTTCSWCGNTPDTTTRAMVTFMELSFCHFTHLKDYRKYYNFTVEGN